MTRTILATLAVGAVVALAVPVVAANGAPGVCRTFGDATLYPVCVPATSPDGGEIIRVWEDGSAGYADGWGVDPDGSDGRGGATFVPPGQGWAVR